MIRSGRAETLPAQFQDPRHHLADADAGGIQQHRIGGGLQGGTARFCIPLVPGAYVMKKAASRLAVNPFSFNWL